MNHDTDRETIAPDRPIARIVAPIERFMRVEAASGIVLLACTIAALVLANSRFSAGFLAFWETEIGFHAGAFGMELHLKEWINDGLMTIFFFVVGLEVKRELVLGELREVRKAALPVAAAVGGMVVPALIYLAFQAGEPGERGWGIPMATDIAFVVGCMAVLGSRVSPILRVMVLSLAIVDDVGAILVIAVGYASDLQPGALLVGLALVALVRVLARAGVRSLAVYTVAGILVWYSVHESGIHATIAGVVLGLLTPARAYLGDALAGIGRAGDMPPDDRQAGPRAAERVRKVQWAARESVSPLEYLESVLHPWVGFVVMPVFALANAGVAFDVSDFGHPVAIAVLAGLVLGKPIGITAATWLLVRVWLRRLPEGLTWGSVLGGACLSGIGFTMALFIAGLALEGPLLDAAKVGVLGASTVAALLGSVVLSAFARRRHS